MLIILFIPLGLFCLALSFFCLRARHLKHALACALFGAFFLSSAALMGYGTNILLQGLPEETAVVANYNQ